jgi:hypothetical protein
VIVAPARRGIARCCGGARAPAACAGAVLPRCWPRLAVARRHDDEFAIKAVSQTRLAYVVTGNADVDSIVKAGMSGLTCSSPSAPRWRPAIPSASIPRATNWRSSR